MAETWKVRLVRCPKCDNLLPELPNYSIYRCGGCNALLRAKKKVGIEKEKDKEDFEKLENFSETERETSNGGFVEKKKDGIFGERTGNLIQNTNTKIDTSISEIVKDKIMGYQHGVQKREIGYNDRHKLPLKHPIGNCVVGEDDIEMNMDRSEAFRKEKGLAEMSAQANNGSARPLRSNPMARKWGLERDGLESPYGKYRMVNGKNTFLHSAHPVEGPSNYSPRPPAYGNRDSDLDQYRAELLWKLEELNEQIRRSGSVAENKKREGSFMGVKIAPLREAADHVQRSPRFNQHGRGPFLQENSHNTDLQEFYVPPKHLTSDFPAYNDPIQLQMLNTNTHQPFGQYQQQMLYHEPASACDCFHCYSKNQHIASQNRRIPKDPTQPNFSHPVNPFTFGSKYHIPPTLHSQDLQSHAVRPSDIDSDIDILRQGSPRRLPFRPVAGGAPFMICCGCFELLKVPRKVKDKNQQKMKCGSCSIVLLLEIRNKQLTVSSVLEQQNGILDETNDSSCEVLKEDFLNHDRISYGGVNSSVDYDAPGYEFQLTDFGRNSQSEDKYEKRQGLSSPSSVSSNEEESLDSINVQRDFSYFPKLEKKENDDLSNHEMDRYEAGNRSKRTEQGKIYQQNSVDVASETEVEVSFNEYLNTSLSQDSMEATKEEQQSRIDKGSESYLAGLLKKGFKDFSRSDKEIEKEKHNVFVNGQPIPDILVKRAEKLAGPVHPGDYWYDFQAGFWGVMGQPCLGIIPPFIKEFNYPMKENCAAGNTGVFVNGRELNQQDLDLLASRGLPTTQDKFYKLEISGRLIEKDTGKELKSLGKLAPTVLKLKRGFGMKVQKKRV